MQIEFKLPELGENIEAGDIVNVLVRQGDVIRANDGVFELETDKAVVEIPCPHTGKIAIEDLRGGTFTVSNLGAVGGVYSTPIINHPEVAILLVGQTLKIARQGAGCVGDSP